MTPKWLTNLRWWLSIKIQPKTFVIVHVEQDDEERSFERTVFDNFRDISEGSDFLYHTREKVPHLTVRQQGDNEFREKLILGDWLQRNLGGRKQVKP